MRKRNVRSIQYGQSPYVPKGPTFENLTVRPYFFFGAERNCVALIRRANLVFGVFHFILFASSILFNYLVVELPFRAQFATSIQTFDADQIDAQYKSSLCPLEEYTSSCAPFETVSPVRYNDVFDWFDCLNKTRACSGMNDSVRVLRPSFTITSSLFSQTCRSGVCCGPSASSPASFTSFAGGEQSISCAKCATTGGG